MSKAENIDDSDPFAILGEALESAAETLGDATSNARASAKIAARKTRETIGAGVYKTAYGVSYGLVFGAVFLTELLPEDHIVRRGLEEGAEAGRAAASEKAHALTASRDLEAPKAKAARAPARKKSGRSSPEPTER